MLKNWFPIQKLHLARTMMWAAILLIVAFQAYWIRRLYAEEKETLKKETNSIFREVVYNLQVERFKRDTHFFPMASGTAKPSLFTLDAVNAMRKRVNELRKKDSAKIKKVIDTVTNMVFVVDNKTSFHSEKDSGSRRRFSFTTNGIPAEMKAMMQARGGAEGGRIIIGDTSMLRKMAEGMNGGGGSISIVTNSKTFSSTASATPQEKQKDKIVYRPAAGKTSGDRPPPLPLPGEASVSIRLNGSPEKTFMRMITDGKTLDDTLPLKKVDSAYRKELARTGILLDFTLRMGKDDSLHRKDTVTGALLATSPTTVGLIKPHWYQAEFDSPASLLVAKISPQILFSLFLVAFTSVAFTFLYRNLSAQRRLTEMKNDFISNITHELKTPIATVSVAVEALRNFGGIQSPERTKEYLDISASELQRLSLLVDKVLKLSMFENRELELKKETFDLKELVGEVLNTMKLQFDKHHAKVDLSVQGHYFAIDADRLHITSVVYNLLDNALKYSNDKPEIAVRLRHETETVILEVADKGIGIADNFRDKIFDKFFRVPTGDHHNIKGYGLGLSYVSHVVKKHGGSIQVESEPGKGSTFTVKLPIA